MALLAQQYPHDRFELLIVDDEGHGLTKHGNRSRAYGHAVAFVRTGL